MSDLLRRIDAHLTQCHREDESERLLAEAKAEIARLSASRDRAIEGYQGCVDKYEALVGKYGALLDGSELASAKAEIARLNHEMEATKEAARAREAILQAENALLREAGEDFASAADEADEYGYEDDNEAAVSVGACRAFRAALNGEAGQ